MQISISTTQGLVDDYNNQPKHELVMKAERFARSAASPTVYYSAVIEDAKILTGIDAKDMELAIETIELKIITMVSLVSKSASLLRKKTSKAPKHADIYRRWSKTLRSIFKRNGTYSRAAQDLLAELFLEQSLPAGELEAPDYLDHYTGEQIQEEVEEQGGANGTPVRSPMSETIVNANIAAADLGWDEATVAQFVKAQASGFSEFSFEEKVEDDDREFVPPTLLKDFELKQELIINSYDSISAFNAARKEVFDSMKEDGVDGISWLIQFRERIEKRAEFVAMVKAIEEVAREHSATAVAVWLKVEGDYGVTEENIESIRVYEDAYSTLVDYAEENEMDILELMNDGVLAKTTEDDQWWMIAEFDGNTISKLAAKMPKYHHNPIATSSWNMGFFSAVVNGADWKQSEEAAWNSWREAMSPEGAKAYNAMVAANEPRNKAMAAFWGKCGREVPRPQSKIKTIAGDGSGLVLEDGRRISWAVAKIKARANEFNFGANKAKLIAKLTELKIGLDFVKIIA